MGVISPSPSVMQNQNDDQALNSATRPPKKSLHCRLSMSQKNSGKLRVPVLPSWPSALLKNAFLTWFLAVFWSTAARVEGSSMKKRIDWLIIFSDSIWF